MSSRLRLVPRSPGLYTLIVELCDRFSRVVGSLGVVELDKGLYVYVGSARGPGGLYARIRRHASREKRVRWHIDYITTWGSSRVLAAVYAVTSSDLEPRLARELEALGLEPAVRGFGCSDKPSFTHLFRCVEPLELCVDACVEAMRRLGLEPRAVALL
ncbi:MAG: GIY-YIG nuclease family protein [Crenarchaeota archaeon]|nr:GIY-YIG nuclease family protein [Thermoproteota archaeon]